MDPQTQRRLELVQQQVNLTFRKLHDHNGNWDDCVTALVSTILKEDNDEVLTHLVLFGGVLSSKFNSLLRGHKRSGVILTTQWVFHKQLRQKIRDILVKHFEKSKLALGKTPHMVVGVNWLTSFQRSIPVFSSIEAPILPSSHRCKIFLEGALSFESLSKTHEFGADYSVTIFADRNYSMEFNLQSSPACVVRESSCIYILYIYVCVDLKIFMFCYFKEGKQKCSNDTQKSWVDNSQMYYTIHVFSLPMY